MVHRACARTCVNRPMLRSRFASYQLVVLLLLILFTLSVYLHLNPAGEVPTQLEKTRLRRIYEANIRFILPPPEAILNGSEFSIWKRPISLLAEQNKLFVCTILKNGNTAFLAFFARRFSNYTGGPGNTKEEMDLLWGKKLLDGLNFYYHDGFFKQKEVQVERVAKKRIWADVSWNKWDNLACFLEANLKWLQRYSRTQDMESFHRSMSVHFCPQSWSCGLHNSNSYHYNRVFQLSKDPSFTRSVDQALLDVGWPRDLVMSGWGTNKDRPFLSSSNSYHSTAVVNSHTLNLTKQHIRTAFVRNRRLSELFLETYWVDYVLLRDFSPPQFMFQQCSDCGTACADWALCRVWDLL